jgi:WD40 repeat protein
MIRDIRQHVFSPNVEGVAVHDDNRNICVVEIKTGKELLRIPGIRSNGHLSFTPDGTHLAWTPGTLDPGKDQVRIWNVETGKEVASFQGMKPAVFHPSGQFLVCTGANSAIELWNVPSHKKVAGFRAHAEEIRDLAFSSAGTRLASCDGNMVKVWDVSPWVD